MAMTRLRLAMGVASLMACSSVLSADLMDSAACRSAREALQTQEDQAASAPVSSASSASQPDVSMQQLRRRVAQDCLGWRPGAQVPGRSGSDGRPVVVMPGRAGTRPTTLQPTPMPAPAPRPEPLRSLGACDAAGCWTSDGQRLQRMGPNLVGPRGVCAVNGSVVSCP